jgi:glycosyltransferase involved in cell wall biosynthesis
MRFKVDEQIFEGATAILALGNYIADVIKEHYPEKNIHVFKEGIESSNWYVEKGIKLKHPCVGLVQRASWWGKSSEMLILKKILGRMPEVNFYWVGGGDVENEILSELNGFENFHWLGSLKYPDQVRQFLSEIDVYLLATGMETTPLSLKEAQLMKRPVISTNVGGTYETMIDGTTGFLVEKGNHEQLIEKLKLLLDNKKMSEQMGEAGRKFIQETFSTESMAKIFVDIIKPYLRNK